jgi:hypothetical protein
MIVLIEGTKNRSRSLTPLHTSDEDPSLGIPAPLKSASFKMTIRNKKEDNTTVNLGPYVPRSQHRDLHPDRADLHDV